MSVTYLLRHKRYIYVHTYKRIYRYIGVNDMPYVPTRDLRYQESAGSFMYTHIYMNIAGAEAAISS